MDHGGGRRSSSRLRDRLARMFRPAALLRSTCNTTASGAACSSSTSSTTTTSSPAGGPASSNGNNHHPPPPSACSSSRALLAGDRDSFLASSRRDLAARTESFSTAVDRLHRRAASTLPPSRFSLDAPQPTTLMDREKKEKSPRDVVCHVNRRHRLGGDANIKDKNDAAGLRMELLSTNPYGFSTSDDDDTDVFSSDAEDLAGRRGSGNKKLAVGESAAETFFCSSRSFSSDSSEFYTKKKKKSPCSAAAAAAKNKRPPNKKKPPPARRGHQHLYAGSSITRRHRRAAAVACDTCGVRDGFRPVVVSSSEEQVRRGFAVVKRSRDPYADFRASMVEMMVGRQMLGAPDMERLLRSYLSLNAPRHHPVILQAFSDIWVVVHGG